METGISSGGMGHLANVETFFYFRIVQGVFSCNVLNSILVRDSFRTEGLRYNKLIFFFAPKWYHYNLQLNSQIPEDMLSGAVRN